MGGLILDSSIAIAGERTGMTPTDLLHRIRAVTQSEDVGLTAIGVTELVHGIYRAESPSRAQLRREFLTGLLEDLPVHDYTLQIAEIAGRIDGEQTVRGNIIPVIDLLIGATALHLGFPILTTNVRHFRKIPGLHVIPF